MDLNVLKGFARFVCFLLVLGRTAFGWGSFPSQITAQLSTCWGLQSYAATSSRLFRHHNAHNQKTQLQVFSAYEEDEYYEEDEEDEEEEVTDEELAATMGEWDERIARFNTVHLTGRVGNDPEPRYFDDGNVVVNLSLATKCKYHGLERKAFDIKAGDEETDWYGLEIWGQKAEFVAKYVDKGARIGVLGQLQIDAWNDKETNIPRKRAKVIVRELDILETKAEAELRRSRSGGPSSNVDNDGGFF